MAKVIEQSLRKKGKSQSRRSMASRSIVSPQGTKVRAPLVDADSDTFGEDLLKSFERSVNRARRDMKS